MAQRMLGAAGLCPLDLADNNPEMHHDDDIFALILSHQAIDSAIDPRRETDPVFPIGRGGSAGAVKIFIYPIRIIRVDVIKAFQLPVAKMDLAQLGLVRQAQLIGGNRISGCTCAN